MLNMFVSIVEPIAGINGQNQKMLLREPELTFDSGKAKKKRTS